MTVATIQGFDATHSNIGTLPHGQAAGYSTGSSWLVWTPEDWAAHPGALRIDQDPGASDATADYLDVEGGAATPADAPGWYRRALADYHQAKRPGQRWPAIYASAGSIPDVANALIAGGVTSGPGLVVAHYGVTRAEAEIIVANAAGPFPVVGFQYEDAGAYDCNVFSVPWLENVSGKTPPPPAPGTYGRPRNLHAVGGHTSVALTWDAPGTPGLPAPAEYLVFVYKGVHPNRLNLVHSYPRPEPSALQEQVGSLETGKTYTVHVVAAGPDGSHVRPQTYASATVTTG